MMGKEARVVEISQEEARLLLKYGYPFDNEKAQLDTFKDRPGPHFLRVDLYYLSMLIAELSRSARKIRSGATIGAIDELCSVLESAEDQGRQR